MVGGVVSSIGTEEAGCGGTPGYMCCWDGERGHLRAAGCTVTDEGKGWRGCVQFEGRERI